VRETGSVWIDADDNAAQARRNTQPILTLIRRRPA